MRVPDSLPFIIAEAGVNHNGSLELARKLVVSAANAGADGVKFQTFKAVETVSRFAPKADYQKKTTGEQNSQLEMVRKFELTPDEHRELITCCEENGVLFLSSPFDLGSIELLADLRLPVLKIPSGEITNLPYLRSIGRLGKRLILSTGMSDLGEIERALAILMSSGTALEQITVLHCTTEYPAPVEEANLRAMLTIRDTFGVSVGYSDHTPGWEVSVAAVALGASLIEKHLTLDRTMEGPDHTASLEPEEFAEMVRALRNVQKALGNGVKEPSLSERKNMVIARKSIVATRRIEKSEIFSPGNVTVKRPGNGISPMEWDNVMGRSAPRVFETDEPIEL